MTTPRSIKAAHDVPFTLGGSLDIEPEAPPPEEVTEADRKEPVPPAVEEPPPAESYDEGLGLPVLMADKPPEWAKIPKGFRVPAGVRPIFLRFRPNITRAPQKGERQCIVWELTDVEEVQAARRGAQTGRNVQEAAKLTIRAIDGHPVDWSGVEGPGNVDQFWREIGPKGRQMLVVVYVRTHQMLDSEMNDFFANCAAVRAAV